jgi:hypothetical protein
LINILAEFVVNSKNDFQYLKLPVMTHFVSGVHVITQPPTHKTNRTYSHVDQVVHHSWGGEALNSTAIGKRHKVEIVINIIIE